MLIFKTNILFLGTSITLTIGKLKKRAIIIHNTRRTVEATKTKIFCIETQLPVP